MQANTKFKQWTMLEIKFQKFNGLIYGRCFLLITVLFSVDGFFNFSPEKKNVKDSSGAFIGQGNGY